MNSNIQRSVRNLALFSVLAGMRLFYTALNRINQLPEVGLQDLFRPFIDIWLVRTRKSTFAARHFRRIVVMREGEIVFDGPPDLAFAPANVELLASTGLRPPPAARIAALMSLDAVPADAEGLLRLLGT